MTSQDPRPSSENTLSTPQLPQYVYPTYYPAHQDDEIDLFELFAALYRRRWFIISMTAMTALLSLIYVSFLATPTYEVKALLRAPTDSTVLPLRAHYTNSNSNSNEEFNNEGVILNIDTEEALVRFQTALESRALQRQIFEASLTGQDSIPWSGNPKNTVKSLDQLFISDFLERLSIGNSKIDKNALVTTPAIEVHFLANVPAAAAEIVNHLIASANQQATDLARQDYISRVQQLIDESEAALTQAEAQAKSDDRLIIRRKQETIALEVARLELEIAAKRDLLARQHKAKIQDLKDALVIAERLEITENKLIGVSPDSAENSLRTEDSDNGNLYLRGTKALQAQIDILKNQPLENLTSSKLLELERLLKLAKTDPEIDLLERRTDYAAFVPNGEQLRRKIAELRSLRNRDLTDLNFVQIDLPALEPAKPIKPKKALIVAGATLASAMLAMMIALILNMRDNRRKGMQD